MRTGDAVLPTAPSTHLKEITDHACHAPNIRTRAPLIAQDDFGAPVLPCLYIVCEMVVHPARVTQVCDFDRNEALKIRSFLGFVVGFEADRRHLSFEQITVSTIRTSTLRGRLRGLKGQREKRRRKIDERDNGFLRCLFAQARLPVLILWFFRTGLLPNVVQTGE